MKVKVCDVRSSDFENDFVSSIKNTGFAVLTHHGVDHGLIKESQDAWKSFFLRDSLYKTLFVNYDDPNMGYKGMSQEKAVGASVADIKEFFHWKPNQRIAKETMALTQKMFFMLEDLGGQVLRALDKDSGNEDNFYTNACNGSDNTIIRALYYPAISNLQEFKKGAVRSAAHEDINFITLLVAASAAGLQVKDSSGEWFDVPHEDNSIVVNVGDMLQLASKRRYRSTTHRVTNPTDLTKDRLSMPFFMHPHSSVLLAEGITAQQYLNQRLEEIYLKS